MMLIEADDIYLRLVEVGLSALQTTTLIIIEYL